MGLKHLKLIACTALCGISFLFCGGNSVFAFNENEQKVFLKIEGERNGKEINKEKLNESLDRYILDKNYSKEFRLYCLSVKVRISTDENLERYFNNFNVHDLDLNDKDNELYSKFLFRCINRLNSIPQSERAAMRKILQNVVENGINFLASDEFTEDFFTNKSDFYRLDILRSVFVINTFRFGSPEQRSKICENIYKMPLEQFMRDGDCKDRILLQLAKIPHDTKNQLDALNALIGDKTFDDLATNDFGREVLLQLAKIPGEQQQTRGLEALNALIGEKTTDQLADDDFGREVLLQLAKIPHNTKKQLDALNALKGKKTTDQLADDDFGREVLLALAKIPPQAFSCQQEFEAQKERQQRALDALIGNRKFDDMVNNDQDISILECFAQNTANDANKRVSALKALESCKKKLCLVSGIAKNIYNHTPESELENMSKEFLEKYISTPTRGGRGRGRVFSRGGRGRGRGFSRGGRGRGRVFSRGGY